MTKILGIAKLSSKAQITIPKEVREIMGLNAKDKILFIQEDEKIIIRKA
jgi:AbrB family looped-hinge helix DNA binding protein